MGTTSSTSSALCLGTTWLLAALAALGACKVREDQPRGSFAELGAPSSASAPRLLPGAPPAKPPFKTRMRDHALHGGSIRDAVVRGDVNAARAAARSLDVQRDDVQAEPGLEPGLDRMLIAARSVRDARDVSEAARGLGNLAESCGSCHAEIGGPALTLTGPPPEPLDVASRMARHAWAESRLWEGLVGPSSDVWSRGARALDDAPLDPAELTPGKTPVAKVDALARTFRGLGKQAAAAEDSVRRGQLYGEMLATCASCHAWFNATPGRRAP